MGEAYEDNALVWMLKHEMDRRRLRTVRVAKHSCSRDRCGESPVG